MNRRHSRGALLTLPILLKTVLRRLVVALVFTAVAVAQTPKRITPFAPTQAAQFNAAGKVGVAILVGVGNYPRYSGLSALHYPAEDVDSLAAVLKQLRYTVLPLKDSDATRASILNAVEQVGEAVAGESLSVVFFFSGHGFAVDGENYLATLDANSKNLASTGLSIKAVEQALAKTHAARRVLWIDACRDEPGKGVGGARSFAALQAAEGTRLLLSTKAGNVTYEDEKLQHGMFSYFLVKGLRGEAAGPDGLVTFQDLASYVTTQVKARSLETGHLQIPYEAGESSGDFLLAGNMPAGAPLLPQTPTPITTPPASAQSDVQRYVQAMAIQDPDQLEAIANTISTKTYADALRMRAQMLRNSGAKPTANISGSSSLDLRTKMRMTTAKMEADGFAKRGNYMQALPLYQQVAESGNSQAMVNLGMIYRDGLGTAQNYGEALKWFQKGADLGEPQAMGYLGMMYFLGEGVATNYALAFQWNQKAAQLGNTMGMLGLGVAFQTGHGAAKDLTQAASWCRKAALLGDPSAKGLLQKMGLSQ